MKHFITLAPCSASLLTGAWSCTKEGQKSGWNRVFLTGRPALPQNQCIIAQKSGVTMANKFRIVAIGDSIIWGQGLLDSEKFR